MRITLAALPVLALAFLSTPAVLAKERLAARADAAVRAKPAENAAVVVRVKKGDPLVVLKEEGPWVQVQAAGKTGWVPARVVRDPKLAAKTVVAVAEADTALALRECPVRKAILVSTKEHGAVVEAILEASKTVDVLSTRSDVPRKAGSPAGGVDAAVAMATPDAADVVIGVAGAAPALAWEIVHVKGRKVLAAGTSKTPEEAAAIVLYHLERASHDTHHVAAK